MQIREYKIRFLTPAFLGNAEQNGQWRTPPFKALLRQWWRVAVAADMKYDFVAIRKRENDLFGVAADGGDSHKSKVRIRLSRWDAGKLTSWKSIGTVTHPEVKNKEGQIVSVGSDLYLGYGPLTFQNGTALKKNAAIQSGEEALFSLAFPEEYTQELETALWLVDRYGTLGGRSRNGWGSLTLTPADDKTTVLKDSLGTHLARDWQQALALDWPHAIGSDGSPLIWQTEACTDWQAVMKRLAEIKISLRTQFTFTTGKDAAAPEERHWLSYPVTNHNIKTWREREKGDFRLPNSLRFKIRQDENGKMRGVIFHVPCKPPVQFRPDNKELKTVWQQVHQYLGSSKASVTRIVE